MGFTITDASPTDAAPLARSLGDWVRETGWMPILHSRDEDRAFRAGGTATSTTLPRSQVREVQAPARTPQATSGSISNEGHSRSGPRCLVLRPGAGGG